MSGSGPATGPSFGGITQYMNQGPQQPTGFGSGVSYGGGFGNMPSPNGFFGGVTPGQGLGPWLGNLQNYGYMMPPSPWMQQFLPQQQPQPPSPQQPHGPGPPHHLPTQTPQPQSGGKGMQPQLPQQPMQQQPQRR